MSAKTRSIPETAANTPDHTDKQLKHINEDIIPDDPYLLDLRIPSRAIVDRNHVNDWRKGYSFWHSGEEQLQYLTFLPHTKRDDVYNHLRVIEDWSDGKGGLRDDPSRRTSGSSTGSIGSPMPGQPRTFKKKISLADYKKRNTTQSQARTSPKPVEGEKTTADLTREETRAAVKPDAKMGKVNTVVNEADQEKRAETREEPRGQKRPADDGSEDQIPKVLDVPSPAPPTKKARVTPEAAKISQPTKSSTANPHGLPELLSPTLPPIIEKELAKLVAEQAKGKHRPNGSVSSTSDKLSSLLSSSPSRPEKPQSSPLSNKKDAERPKKNAAGLKASSAASVTTKKVLSPQVHPQKNSASKSDPSIKHGGTNGIAGAKDTHLGKTNIDRNQKPPLQKPVTQLAKLNQPITKKLLVKLKIPKRLRINCQRILQMKPRAKKVEPNINGLKDSPPVAGEKSKESAFPNGIDLPRVRASSIPKPRDSVGAGQKGVAEVNKTKAVPNTVDEPRSGEKRRRESDEKESLLPNSKRTKPPTQTVNSTQRINKPHTPLRSSARSPHPHQPNSSQKPQLATPLREIKSTAMQRVSSMEGDSKTPQAVARDLTPTIPNTAERSKGESSSAAANRNEDVGILKADYQKYADLGKAMKREASNSLQDPNVSDKKQALVLTVESLLCFVLAFSINDEKLRLTRVPPDAMMWRSILQFAHYVRQQCEADPHLKGFVLQVEAICREAIASYEIDRIESPSASATNEENQKFRHDFADNFRVLPHMWAHGTTLLSANALTLSYPETWAKRAQVPLASHGKERPVPGHYGDGSYYLPLGSVSSGFEVVRMGLSLLGEWCAKEGVDWKARMEL
ncbi:MAG: hypothetical protein Q9167_007190 [Letrouitia subvulpina]